MHSTRPLIKNALLEKEFYTDTTTPSWDYTRHKVNSTSTIDISQLIHDPHSAYWKTKLSTMTARKKKKIIFSDLDEYFSESELLSLLFQNNFDVFIIKNDGHLLKLSSDKIAALRNKKERQQLFAGAIQAKAEHIKVFLLNQGEDLADYHVLDHFKLAEYAAIKNKNDLFFEYPYKLPQDFSPETFTSLAKRFALEKVHTLTINQNALVALEQQFPSDFLEKNFSGLEKIIITTTEGLPKELKFPPSVTTLELSCNSRGNVPNTRTIDLASYVYLKKLTLDGTCTRLSLPPNLESLDLSGSGSLPNLVEFSVCPQLKILNLSYTEITELPALPPALESLDLSGCSSLSRLTGISACSKLKTLNLAFTAITELPSLPQSLESLDLTRCFSLRRFTGLAACSQLKTLNLTSTPITELPSLPPALESLDLSSNHSLQHLAGLAAYSQLKTLNLASTAITELPSLPPALESLDLSSNHSLQHLAGLAAYSQLKTLNLARTAITELPSLPLNIESLSLSDCHSLPPLTGLSVYSQLKALNLAYTDITELPSLPQSLESLNLSGCGSLCRIAGLAVYSQLKILKLSHTAITGMPSLPQSLESLDLSGNRSLQHLVGLSACSQLKTLNLSYTAITELPSLPPTLESLSLYNCTLLCSLPKLSACPQLKTLNLASTDITELPSLPQSLESLDLSNCNSLSSLTGISACSQLKTLNLTSTDITELPSLSPALESLNLSNCRSLCRIAGLAACSQLKTLNLAATAITELPSLPQSLESLDLSRCRSLRHLTGLAACSQLKTLNLVFTAITELPYLSPTLESLNLSSCRSLHHLAGLTACSQLRELNLAYAPITELPSLPPTLRSLDLSGCRSLRHLTGLAACSQLITLDLSRTAITELPPLPPHIKSLLIRDCDNLHFGEKEAAQLKQKHPNLSIIYGHSSYSSGPHPTQGERTAYNNKPPINNPLNSSLFSNSPITTNTVTFTDPQETITAHYAIYTKKNHQLELVAQNTYRHKVKNCIAQNKQKEISFGLDLEEHYSACNVPELNKNDLAHFTDGQYLVHFPLEKTLKWQALPSLGAHDAIIKIQKPENSQLRYNQTTQQYEIQLSEITQAIDLYYIGEAEKNPNTNLIFLSADKGLDPEVKKQLKDLLNDPNKIESSHEKFKPLKEKILQLTDCPEKERFLFCKDELPKYFRSFKNEALSKETDHLDPCLRVLFEGKGACEHRAMAYMLVCLYLGVPAQLITNDVHAYAEILNPDEKLWLKKDLGGADAKLESNHKPLPPISKLPELKNQSGPFIIGDEKPSLSIQSQGQKEATSAVLPPKPNQVPPSKNWRKYFSPTTQVENHEFKTTTEVITHLSKQQRILLKIPNLTCGRAIYENLVSIKEENKPIFYLESAKDIQEFWDLYEAKDGELIENLEGPLKKVILEGGILVISWESFSSDQMTRYKSLMDDPPTFLKTKVVSNLQIINLVTPTTQRNTALLSRAKRFDWPREIAYPTIQHESLSISAQQADNLLAIDLYGDEEQWQPRLIGKLKLGQEGFSFLEEKLMAAINGKYAGIVLLDAPLAAPEFQAFMWRMRAERCFWANGKKIDLPANFKIVCKAPVSISKPAQLQEAKPETIKLGPTSDIFYLNSQTQPSLFEQCQLSKNNQLHLTSGWLSDNSHGPKYLIQTAPLTEGEKRELYAKASESKNSMTYVDLSNRPLEATEPFVPLEDFKAEVGASLIETADPAFIAQLLKRNHPTAEIIVINQQTKFDNLIEKLELIKEPRDASKRQNLCFHYELQKVTEALQEDKTVILSGELALPLYMSLETLWGSPPQLNLTKPNSKPVTGRLIVVTTPLSYNTPLAALKQKKFTVPTESLWDIYEKELKQGPNFSAENFNKIKIFYHLANAIDHGAKGTPPQLQLTIARLNQFLETLRQPATRDNPIKAFFHHDYDKDGESYAYLNVLAKVLFGRNTAKAAIRPEKLNDYPDQEEFIWRRANCFNAAALKDIFKELNFNFVDVPNQHQLHQAVNKSLRTAVVQRASIDPQAKAYQRLDHFLKKKNMAVLKGPPGAGKTFTAWAYANKPGRTPFWGEHNIKKWKESNPQPGKESILIIDEFNLMPPGSWDEIISWLNKHPQGGFKVIFTGNEESYPGRSYHTQIRDLPTIYVKKWSNNNLKKYLLLPLLAKSKKQVDASLDQALDKLIAAYRLVAGLAPKETFSPRDLQQVTCRFLYYLEQNKNLTPEEAAYTACLHEWEGCFTAPNVKHSFLISLKDLYKKATHNKKLNTRTWQSSPEYFLSSTRRTQLQGLADNLQLAEKYNEQQDFFPPVKLGVILEGPSGLGKSTLFRYFLNQSGYKECTQIEKLLNPDEKDFSRQFIQFTAGEDLEHDKQVLEAAFQKGCKVILDELNLNPELETLLNQLLTGKTIKGKAPLKSGFYVFASQNSVLDGRKSLSKALKNRCQVFYLEEDSREELIEIAKEALPSFSQDDLEAIVSSFLLEKQACLDHTVNARTFFLGLKKIQAEQDNLIAAPGPTNKPVNPVENKAPVIDPSLQGASAPTLSNLSLPINKPTNLVENKAPVIDPSLQGTSAPTLNNLSLQRANIVALPSENQTGESKKPIEKTELITAEGTFDLAISVIDTQYNNQVVNDAMLALKKSLIPLKEKALTALKQQGQLSPAQKTLQLSLAQKTLQLTKALQALAIETNSQEKIKLQNIALSSIQAFNQETKPYRSNLVWHAIVGAVIGAAIGALVGAVLGLCLGPMAGLTALYGAIEGAAIGASLLGGGGATFKFLHKRAKDPFIQTAISAKTVIQLCKK